MCVGVDRFCLVFVLLFVIVVFCLLFGVCL